MHVGQPTYRTHHVHALSSATLLWKRDRRNRVGDFIRTLQPEVWEGASAEHRFRKWETRVIIPLSSGIKSEIEIL